MSAQHFDSQNDPVYQKPSPLPGIILAVVAVVAIGTMLILGARQTKQPSPTPPPMDARGAATPSTPSTPTPAKPAPAPTYVTTPPTAKQLDEAQKLADADLVRYVELKTPKGLMQLDLDKINSDAHAQRTYAPPTAAEVAAAKRAGTVRATIATYKGNIEVELYGKETPLTVANFVKLAKAKFYDGLIFHRVEPGFCVQGGDPDGNGQGGPGYAIKREISPKLKHDNGILAMARAQDPDSAGSQFYFTLGPQHGLDKEYAVFGKVVKGMDIVEGMRVNNIIKSVTIHK